MEPDDRFPHLKMSPARPITLADVDYSVVVRFQWHDQQSSEITKPIGEVWDANAKYPRRLTVRSPDNTGHQSSRRFNGPAPAI
jgi:hypothetical protein